MFRGLLAFIGTFGGLLGILYFIFWLWMLIDCLKNSRIQGTEKLIWVLVIIILPVLGPLLYFFLAKEQTV
jgi:Phospholipase_D-nuclease N-terminal